MITTFCPNCGENTEETRCDCGFSFNDIFICPYNKEQKCILVDKPCKVRGLDYELCSIFEKGGGN